MTIPIKAINTRYIRWYPKPLQCYYCGEFSHGRAYELMHTVVCGSCQEIWFTVEHSDDYNVETTPLS